MIEQVKVVVPPSEEDLDEDIEVDSVGVCFDSLPSSVQDALIQEYGGIENIRSQAMFSDC